LLTSVDVDEPHSPPELLLCLIYPNFILPEFPADDAS